MGTGSDRPALLYRRAPGSRVATAKTGGRLADTEQHVFPFTCRKYVDERRLQAGPLAPQACQIDPKGNAMATTPTTVKDTGKPARPATDPAGPTGRLATWVAKTTLDDVPASVRDRAKHLMLDGIACALVGAQLPWSRLGVEGVTALDSAGDTALVGWDGRATSATSAAMLNSSFIQGFELDDYHPLAPLHSNSLVLPAMLAAAPRVGRVSGERFLLGAILGYETGPRVGQALGGLDMLSARVAFGRGLRHHSGGRVRRYAVWTGRRRVRGRLRDGGHPVLRAHVSACTNRWSSACNTASPRATA